MGGSEDESIGPRLFAVALEWMTAEENVRGLDQAARYEAQAQEASARYEAAVSEATAMDLDAACRAAVEARSAVPTGGSEWLALDLVVRLLDVEARARAAIGP